MIRLIAFIALVFLFALATSTLAAEPATATVRIDRLEKLATYIEKLSPDRLFMPSYHGSGDSDDPYSSGCALYHGTATFAFRGDGLILVPSRPGGPRPYPSYRGLSPFDSARAFFGLSEADAAELFGNLGRTPAEEAAMLRAVASRERVRLARIEVRGRCWLADW
jgi:hypothetical protein